MDATALNPDIELDRQLRAVRKGEASAVVCPWCGGRVSELEPDDCCDEFVEAKDRLAKAHLQKIQRQVSGIRNGIQSDPSIECPYCGGINRPENVVEDQSAWKRPCISPYCCDLFFSAVMRLADHQGVQEQIDMKRRIEDGIAKARVN